MFVSETGVQTLVAIRSKRFPVILINDHVDSRHSQPDGFQKPCHFLFNVAVSGVWPETPDPGVFPQRTEFDYIQVPDRSDQVVARPFCYHQPTYIHSIPSLSLFNP
jgi:hypothetical protein